jgi:hypothetical protein
MSQKDRSPTRDPSDILRVDVLRWTGCSSSRRFEPMAITTNNGSGAAIISEVETAPALGTSYLLPGPFHCQKATVQPDLVNGNGTLCASALSP